MELVTPSIGLVFWTTIAFLILIFVLGKFAWKPIMQALAEREQSIEDALSSAEKAKEELTRLNNESEQLLKVARSERDTILKEAKQLRDNMVADAKGIAQIPRTPSHPYKTRRSHCKMGMEFAKVSNRGRETNQIKKSRGTSHLWAW